MADETLSVVVKLAISGEGQIDGLIRKLTELDRAASAVDPIDIDVNILDALSKLAFLQQQLLQTQQLGERDIDMDVDVGSAAMRTQMSSLIALLNKRLVPGGTGGALGNFMGVVDDAAKEADSFIDDLIQGRISMSQLHNAMARVIPLLLVFIGALPAAIAGLVSLGAAAFAAAAALIGIAGFGALGFAAQVGGGDIGAGFEEITSRIQTAFVDAFEPLMEDLAPIFEEGLSGLERLFDAIAARRGVLLGLRDDARAFGAFVLDFVPTMLAELGRFAEAAGPALGQVADALSSMNLSRALAGVLADTLPALIQSARVISSLIGPLIRMSTGFLLVTTAVLQFFGAIGRVLSALGITARQLGVIIATVLTGATAWFVFGSIIRGGVIPALATVGSTILTTVIPAIQSGISSLFSLSSASLTSAISITALRNAIIGLLSITVIGAVVAGIGMVATQALTAKSNIDDATSSLKDFANAQNQLNEDSPFGAPDPNVERGSLGTASRGSDGKVDVTVNSQNDRDVERDMKRTMFSQQTG